MTASEKRKAYVMSKNTAKAIEKRETAKTKAAEKAAKADVKKAAGDK